MEAIIHSLNTHGFSSMFFGMKTEEQLEKLRVRSATWRANHPERARELGRKSGKKLRDAKAVAEGREPGHIGRVSIYTPEERKAKRKALDDASNAIKKLQAAGKAISEGREPGRVGRPPILTPDEKEVSRITQNKKRSKRSAAKKKLKLAEKAIFEGREPGKVGGPRRLSDVERVVNRKFSYVKWRMANLEEIRARDAELSRGRTAARALAEGRVPGVLGHLATFTAEDLAAYMERWPREKSVYHGRAKTQNSRAKKMGAPGAITAMDVQEVYIEQMGCCAFCAKPFGDEIPEIDHWVPIVKGGANTKENIRLLHMVCNRTKGGKHPEEFGLPTMVPLTKKGD